MSPNADPSPSPSPSPDPSPSLNASPSPATKEDLLLYQNPNPNPNSNPTPDPNHPGLVAPPWLSRMLVDTVGFRRAERMLQLGTLLEPEAALAAGLVDEVC